MVVVDRTPGDEFQIVTVADFEFDTADGLAALLVDLDGGGDVFFFRCLDADEFDVGTVEGIVDLWGCDFDLFDEFAFISIDGVELEDEVVGVLWGGGVT